MRTSCRRCTHLSISSHLLRPRPFICRPRGTAHTTTPARPLRLCSTMSQPQQQQQAVPERPKQPQPKQEKKAKADKKAATADAGPLELEPPPAYFQHRIDLFERLKKQYDEEIAQKERTPITITLPDGRIEAGKAWETTPAAVALSIAKSLLESTVIAKVNDQLWDLERPLEGDCKLELLKFDHPDGKFVFWHSSAHVLGEAAERRYGCHLCIGPPVDDGFFYEMALPDGAAVQPADFPALKKIAEKAIKEKQKFERLEVSKTDLLEMFKTNKYKQHIINDKIPDGTKTTVYRCGPLIDLCRGPHVPDTGRIKTFEIMKNSASYFLGDAKNDSLQRIYGVSFPDKKQMAEHLKFLEEAAKRDHRKIGKEQELFFFHEMSPGSCFFLPHGTIIYNTLQAELRKEYWKRGYQEVMSPQMFNSELWKRSGHWQHYQDDMFTFDVEKDRWALKPMNCPGHALMFGHRERSYKELPLRIADFGILHRNEASGALTGLTRVRKFSQDDAHIFCREDQIEQEIIGLFDFLKAMYGHFGFVFKMKLSTRPEGFLGDIETWDRAEDNLRRALDQYQKDTGVAWILNPGDGAFYGPKIDITISDALRRDFQCATIQLDFQLPQQFNLEYMTADMANVAKQAEAAKPAAPQQQQQPPPPQANGETTKAADPKKGDQSMATYRKPLTPGYARPVMIHRAVYGSFERFIAVLTEHFGGKWPLWLSPRQILVVPVMPSANDYVLEVQKIFRERGFHADIDISGETMKKKIRTGQLAQYNYIFVVGAEEQQARTVNIRNRDDPATQNKGEMVTLDDAIVMLEKLRDTKALPAVAPI